MIGAGAGMVAGVLGAPAVRASGPRSPAAPRETAPTAPGARCPRPVSIEDARLIVGEGAAVVPPKGWPAIGPVSNIPSPFMSDRVGGRLPAGVGGGVNVGFGSAFNTGAGADIGLIGAGLGADGVGS